MKTKCKAGARPKSRNAGISRFGSPLARSIAAGLLSLLFVALQALTSLASPAVAATDGGPVVLMGIDAEDGGPGTHGPISNYVTLVKDILAKTDQKQVGKGILVIGANGQGPIDFWNAIAQGTAEPVIFGNESSLFQPFKMIAVVGSSPETAGGLSEVQNDILTDRQGEFADFVNGGGGLLGNSQSDFSDPFAYLAGVAEVASGEKSYSDIDPTSNGAPVGITNALDVCCWHQFFVSYPSFLKPLAYEHGSTINAAAIGGRAVSVPTDNCERNTQPKQDVNYAYDNSSTCQYLALGDSFSSGQGVAPYYEGKGYTLFKEGCHRSRYAYGSIYRPFDFDLNFHACNGDKTKQFMGERGAPRPLDACGDELSQIGCIDPAGRDDLITLSIGGNDVGFTGILRDCFTWDHCESHKGDVLDKITKLEPTLERVFSKVRALALKGTALEASDTSVVVLGYPALMAPTLTGACYQFEDPERAYLNEAASALAQVGREAATAAGVHFIDMVNDYPYFQGHESCGSGPSKDWWIQGPALPINTSFHPTAKGQRSGYMRALDAFINTWTGPRTHSGLPANPALPTAPTAPEAPQDSSGLAFGDLVVEPVIPSVTEACQGVYEKGQQIRVHGEGFVPLSPVGIDLKTPDADPIQLKDATSDPLGSINEIVTIPTSVQADDFALVEANGSAAEGGELNLNDLIAINTPGPASPEFLSQLGASSCDAAAIFGSANSVKTAPGFTPQSAAVDSEETIRTESNANGAFEVGETVQFKPTWKNEGTEPVRITGSLSAFTGPPGFSYDIVKSNGDYGTVGVGQTSPCQGEDCYLLAITQDADVPPALPIEATVLETLSNGKTNKWTVKLSDFETVRPDTLSTSASFTPQTLEVDTQFRPESNSNLNGRFDYGETVVVKPSWKNEGTSATPIKGTITAFTGPQGAGYEIIDGTADFGVIGGGQTGSCSPAQNCYLLRVRLDGSPSVAFPAQATIIETLSNGATHTWNFYVSPTTLGPTSPARNLVSAGAFHSLGLSTDTRVRAWGDNGWQQLGTGDGSGIDSRSPVLPILSSGIVSVSSGEHHSIALHADGTVWAWGSNLNGQLGYLPPVGSATPRQVPGLPTIVAISAGANHNLALDSKGELWSWGQNTLFQLGGGIPGKDSYQPVRVLQLDNVIAVAAGLGHNLALRADGTVWTWGYDSNGQLGIGSVHPATVPAQVPNLSGVTAVAAGGNHSMALKADGTVWGWGDNSNNAVGAPAVAGQLAVGSPMRLDGLSGVASIAAGASHSLAVSSSGDPKTWGYNAFGQLGDGTSVSSNSPVAVTGLSGIREIEGGDGHSLALGWDGRWWSWGQNSDGQLGNGTLDDSRVPVRVNGL